MYVALERFIHLNYKLIQITIYYYCYLINQYLSVLPVGEFVPQPFPAGLADSAGVGREVCITDR